MSPLAGRRVLVTRPRDQAGDLIDALARRGALPILLPTIEIRPVADLAPLDRAIEELERFDWLAFTSANAVAVFYDRLAARRAALPPRIRVAAVGSGTARVLGVRGVAVNFVPSRFTGAQLGRELEPVSGRRVLVPRAARGREDLAAELRRRGARVDDVAVYDTLPAAPDPDGLRELSRGVDVATFTSGSTVENYFALLGERAARLLDDALVACIGPVTSDVARSLGLRVDLQPEEHTIPGLVEALEHVVGAGALPEGNA